MSSRLYSIIISGYKETSRQTLEACLALTRSDDVSYEITFLDNTRDSSHASMVRDLFARSGVTAVRTLYLPHPIPGKAEAQNRGIEQARGQYLLFLDDDVLPDPNLVLEYDRGFQAHRCGAIQGRVVLHYEDGANAPSWLNNRLRLDLAEMDFGREIIPFEMGLTGANMAFRAELFQRYGGFDERLGPGRSGTLEDQEFSERIRAKGEVQLFWPHASVRHRIPPARLKIRSFARIYFDVGFSDYFLSSQLIQGGRLKFTLYSLRLCLRQVGRCGVAALGGQRADAIVECCELFKHYGYWRQAMRQMRFHRIPG